VKQQDRDTVLWLLCFLILLGAFYWLEHTHWYQTVIIQNAAELNARLVGRGLSLLGLKCKLTQTAFHSSAGCIEIAASCTGSFVFMVFAAAVLPFPAPWKIRIIGLFLGFVILFTVNLIRIAMIVLISSRFPDSLWLMHVVVGQVIVISSMLIFFLWWTQKSRSSVFFAFTHNHRRLFQTLLLFVFAYLCGYWLYGWFLESSLGVFIKHGIDAHAEWMISMINNYFLSGENISYRAPTVELVEGCLASPIVVFFSAMIFAWPTAWWKKLTIILLGFIPFFYLYHLARSFLIAFTLGFQTKETNIVYNLYGQITLSLAFLTLIALFWRSKQQPKKDRQIFIKFLAGCGVGILLGSITGWIGRHLLLPAITDTLYGQKVFYYDPQQSISLMPDIQGFIWITLAWITPGLSKARKWASAGGGALAALLIFITSVLTIDLFRLSPDVGLIKLGTIVLPFIIYYVLFINPKRMG